KVAAIALANKLARMAWAMMTRGERYKEPVALAARMDRNGDGRADVIFFDLQRRGKWDMSWWDENYTGQWTLVGYHDDGSATPSPFGSFAECERRVAGRQ